ncbi:hypothetical protein [Natrinema altunense]|uniref:Uncharacterized protein n=1 Tax=Natrinema altunense (strain JCM 12890 / CGMCC 1.3731 / AJ2) TaxID=1227494 RepID=L9ZDN1_NATA2|nr:hypothetical protein [Natrinema altunense]ELY84121.1 hypothetical protein C485_16780 [Natrinema altunense JCM 12890]
MLHPDTLTTLTTLRSHGPAAVTPSDLENVVTNPATPEELALAFGLYVLGTIAIGAVVLAVSQSSVRRLETRIVERPVPTGVIGIGVLVGGGVAFAVVTATASYLVAAGVPASVGTGLEALALAFPIGLTVANTVGVIVLGSRLLRRVGRGPKPNLWLALAVGAITVNVLYLLPVVNVVTVIGLVAVATGAIAGQWWHDRRESQSDSTPRERSADG